MKMTTTGSHPPFFITGVPRSGTTLLSVMLGNHPDIYLDGNSVGMALARAYRRYMHRRITQSHRSPGELFDQITAESYKGRLQTIFSQQKQYDGQEPLSKYCSRAVQAFAERHGKKIWGDKTPELNFQLAEICQLFPQARFIHLVRDPRANALSLHKRQHYSLKLAAQYWREINGLALAQQELIGNKQFLTIHYEELVKKPEKTMKKVCDFLNIHFCKEILQPGKHTTTLSKNAYVKPHLQTERIHAWQDKLTPKQQKDIEKISGLVMLQTGYTPIYWEKKSPEQPLSSFQYFLQREHLMWRMLWKKQRKQMIDRQLIDRHIPFKQRFKNFVFGTAKEVFSERFLRIFGYQD